MVVVVDDDLLFKSIVVVHNAGHWNLLFSIAGVVNDSL